MQLKLVVIRTGDLLKLVEFYTLLGLPFEYHKHGNCPFHYSTNINGIVLEIYPLAKGQPVADKNLRLGFAIDNFEEIIILLENNIVSPPTQTDWGYMAVVQDPDGRKVELYKRL